MDNALVACLHIGRSPAGALDPCARDLDFFATPRRSIEAGFWLRFSIIKAASAIDCGNRSTKFNHESARRIGSRTRIEASKFRPNLAPIWVRVWVKPTSGLES